MLAFFKFVKFKKIISEIRAIRDKITSCFSHYLIVTTTYSDLVPMRNLPPQMPRPELM